MCGIFGLVVKDGNDLNLSDINQSLRLLVRLSQRRGKDACGLAIAANSGIRLLRQAVHPLEMLRGPVFDKFLESSLMSGPKKMLSKDFAVIGHCRLVTDGSHAMEDNNHPVKVGSFIGVHNGIIANMRKLLQTDTDEKGRLNYEGVGSENDTQAFYKIMDSRSEKGGSIAEAVSETFSLIEGSASVAFFNRNYPALYLATNTGSLYYAFSGDDGIFVFGSERYIVDTFIKKADIAKKKPLAGISHLLPSKGAIVEFSNTAPGLFDLDGRREEADKRRRQIKLSKPYSIGEDNSSPDSLLRCSKCILPETYPFISFDENNVCYYCHKYEDQVSHGQAALENILDKYRSRNGEPDCLVGLSGGRDSSYGLHLLKTRFGMHPIAYTYDWGLTTDRSRRNQALVCGKLGVEHIIRAADISKKRRDIRDNIHAWLKRPELGMVPLFFAGDKPFLYYGHQLRKETGVSLTINCTGNQLEQMEFKVGFCGIDQHLKSNMKLFSYDFSTKVRLAFWYIFQYLRNPSYINRSLIDSAFAFYSSFLFRDDSLSLYYYIPWDEKEIESTLEREYDWQHDRHYGNNQWRMDDGQTAFTNYIYYTVSGFSEFDNFRSNQVRAGLLTRDEALKLTKEDNKTRIEALRSFAGLIGINLEEVMLKINRIPKLYNIVRK